MAGQGGEIEIFFVSGDSSKLLVDWISIFTNYAAQDGFWSYKDENFREIEAEELAAEKERLAAERAEAELANAEE